MVVHLLCEQGHRPSLFYIKIGRDDVDYMDCSMEEDMEMATVSMGCRWRYWICSASIGTVWQHTLSTGFAEALPLIRM